MLRFILSVMVSVVSVVGAQAQTPFPARFVEAGQTIVVPKGDYVQTRDCIVRQGGTLILEAGARVRVSGLGVPVQVYGTLEVRGTAADPVVIEPDASGICGTVAAYWVSGPRPRVIANHLQLTTTKNTNSMLLSFAEFAISNSVIENRSTSASRVCILAGNNAVGSISDSYLKCLDDGIAETAGVVVGNGSASRQADDVELVNVITEDCKDPVRIRKKFALISGTIQ